MMILFFISVLIEVILIATGIWLAIRISNKYGNPDIGSEIQEDYETVFNRWRQEAQEGKTSLTFQAWRDKYYKLAGERG